MPELSRVDVTDAAAALLRELTVKHGPLMFHQSGGCCDGSSPMCFAAGEFITSDADELLGELVVDPGAGEDTGGGFTVPVWMSKEQFALWSHTHLTIDLVPGRGAGFSLEAPDGVRFLVRSRLMDCGLSAAPPEVVCEVPADRVGRGEGDVAAGG